MKTRTLLLVALISATLATHLFGFAKHGHMATGSLAYQSMSEADRAAVVAILESHPFVSTVWAEQLAAKKPKNVSRGERLFMLAAAWPDEVRAGKWKKKYHKAVWHYVNLEYTRGATAPGPIIGGELLNQLPANLAIAQDKTASPEARAIALCWVMHLTGDLHQPLHVVALVDDDYPKGDRGGNLFFVKSKPTNKPTYLHTMWDNASPKKYTDFAGVQDNAIKLKTAKPAGSLAQLTQRPATKFAEIAAKECFPLAVKFAYVNGTLEGATEHDAEESPDDVPVVPVTYTQDMGSVTYEQLALAGYRLATLLEKVTH